MNSNFEGERLNRVIIPSKANDVQKYLQFSNDSAVTTTFGCSCNAGSFVFGVDSRMVPRDPDRSNF